MLSQEGNSPGPSVHPLKMQECHACPLPSMPSAVKYDKDSGASKNSIPSPVPAGTLNNPIGFGYSQESHRCIGELERTTPTAVRAFSIPTVHSIRLYPS